MTRLISSARALCGLSILLFGRRLRRPSGRVRRSLRRRVQRQQGSDGSEPRDLQVRGLTGSVALLDAEPATR